MSRTVEITVPSHRTDPLLRDIQQLDEIVEMRVQRGVSLDPPGDLITVSITRRSLHDLIRLLNEQGLARDKSASISISEPSAIISPSSYQQIENDVSDVIWEEMEYTLLRESKMDVNGMFTMFAAGVIAAVGIATGAVHLVIGAMIIAPGFEPIIRVSLGVTGRATESWRQGLADVLKGYAALFVGALGAAAALYASGRDVLRGVEAYLPTEILISFWLQISLPSVLIATFAGATGAVLVAISRSVLTAGVMVALALIPPPAIAALALVAGDTGLMWSAVLRWVVEVGIVAAAGFAVVLWKRRSVQQRDLVP